MVLTKFNYWGWSAVMSHWKQLKSGVCLSTLQGQYAETADSLGLFPCSTIFFYGFGIADICGKCREDNIRMGRLILISFFLVHLDELLKEILEANGFALICLFITHHFCFFYCEHLNLEGWIQTSGRSF